ncbi:WxL domain-containing protein [Enterococcus sp. DIV0756]|uniref:WxL domain-containing protein n=1 Tax=Enterococcus sp. DIV0756 TaxID=2774636 RepID=UPI003F2341F6
MWKKFRKVAKVLFFLLLLIIASNIGIKSAHGVTHTQTIPSRKLIIEVLDRNGDPFTDGLTMPAARMQSGTSIPSTWSGSYYNYSYTSLGTDNASVSEIGDGKFEITTPAKTLSVNDQPAYAWQGANGQVYHAVPQALMGFDSLRLNSSNELNYVKNFTTNPPTGLGSRSLYTAYTYQYDGKTSSSKVDRIHSGRKLTNKSFNLADGSIQIPSNGGQVSSTYFGLAVLSSVYSYNSNGAITGTLGWGRGVYGLQGEKLVFYPNYQQITEIFENESKTAIVAPTGFTQSKKTDMTSRDFVYTMENTDNLPKFYTNTAGTIGYTYKGWYRGATKPTNLNEEFPPEISFNPDGVDADDTVHIVYSQASTANLTEQFRDRNGKVIEASWDKASRKVPMGVYTTTPEENKTDTQGRKWEYYGWRVGTTGTIQTTPVSQNLAANSNTTIQYIYQEPKTTGDLSLTIEPEVIDNEGDTTLVAILKNIGTSDMKELKIKFSDKWMLTNGSISGIYSPSFIFVTVEGEAQKKIGTNQSNFTIGQPLTDIVIPAGKEARIEIPIRGRGNPLEMLQAGIEVTGNLIDDEGNDTTLKASNVVRIDDPEAPTIDGEGDAGFVNIFKNLNFGTTSYSPSAQTKALDMTSSPYLRFYNMDDLQPQWSLQAKLDEFKTTGNKTLPTTTSISFKDFQLYDINDYKKTSENISVNGAAISEFVLPSDGNTVEVTNRGNKGYYEIKTGPSNVQLNIPAFAGLSGEAYSSTLTWTLSTGP